MTSIDRLLQFWRIAKARPFIPPAARVLDLGCAEGELFKQLKSVADESMGIDPTLKSNSHVRGISLIAGFFPNDMPRVEPFDVITMLAVLEHFPVETYADLTAGCARFLKPSGRLIITVPSPFVDHLLWVLKSLRLIHGMSLEEHHGFEVSQTETIFPEPDFRVLAKKRFQLGLNHLFVFERTATIRKS